MLLPLATLAHAGCGPAGCPAPDVAAEAPVAATRPVPALDERPEHVEIATFALG